MQNTPVHADIHTLASADEPFGEAYRRYSDVLIATTLEQKEQMRRLADLEEQENRKLIASKASHLISERNSTLINDFVEAHSSKGLYERGAEYASSLLRASSDATHSALEAGQKSIETAQELGHLVAVKAASATHLAQDVVSKANAIVHQGADIVRSAYGKVADIWEDLSDTITWARVVEIEELERERRLQSNSEARAVLNAQKVSALIKDLGTPFYRPTFEPNVNYGTQLLEELERSRRIWEDSTGKIAIVNAQGVSDIVKDSVRLLKTSGHISIPDVEAKHAPAEIAQPALASAVSQ